MRYISVQELREAMAVGEFIEDYPTDKYGPSCLVFGVTVARRSLYMQCSYPSCPLVKIITLYEPNRGLVINQFGAETTLSAKTLDACFRRHDDQAVIPAKLVPYWIRERESRSRPYLVNCSAANAAPTRGNYDHVSPNPQRWIDCKVRRLHVHAHMLAAPRTAPDCLQRPLLRRSRFQQQVSASVRPRILVEANQERWVS